METKNLEGNRMRSRTVSSGNERSGEIAQSVIEASKGKIGFGSNESVRFDAWMRNHATLRLELHSG